MPRASHPPSAIPGWGWHDNNGYGSGHWYRNYYRPSQWYWAPWGFGLGYWSYYDPWYAPAYAYGYGSGYYGSTGGYVEGSVRLKVAPRDAQVFVDGYYVGVVDDFDGNFQRLRLEEGPHRIEVRLDGFEPLDYKVYVVGDRTLTLHGDLRRVVP